MIPKGNVMLQDDCTWKSKGPSRVKIFLKNKMWRIALKISRIYYKAMVIKTLLNWPRIANRPI